MTEIMAQLAELHSATLAILSIVGEIVIIAKRVDYRQTHKGQCRALSLGVQKACYAIWIAANCNAEFKATLNHKPTYLDVYKRWRISIASHGIKDPETFRYAIRAYQQYLLRQNN